jgi:hypothetical protein
VDELMSTKADRRAVALLTMVTFIHPTVVFVDSLVPPVSAHMMEGFTTHVTDIRLIIPVGKYVCIQLAGQVINLATSVTFVRFITGV